MNDTSLAGHHGSALVTARARELAGEAGIDLQSGWNWSAIEKTLAGEHGFDLVVVNGEGSLHDDSATARRIAALGKELHRKRLPAYLINASEERNSALVHEGLSLFRKRYVRDTASQASLAKAGLSSAVVPDLTLSWDRAPIAGGRGHLFVTDASDESASAALLKFARRTGSVPLTLRAAAPWPMRGSPRRWFVFRGKRGAAKLLPESPWSLRYATAICTHDAFVARLTEEASGLVCGRFHAVCIAMRMRLPFLAVAANTSKIESLLADAGLLRRFMDFSALASRSEPPPIPAFSDDERQAIASFVDGALVKARLMFAKIADDTREFRT